MRVSRHEAIAMNLHAVLVFVLKQQRIKVLGKLRRKQTHEIVTAKHDVVCGAFGDLQFS
jgi:hypothetical protein